MVPKLLIVEDSVAIAKVIERIGLSLGYQTTIASSFAQVKTILSHKPSFFAATIDFGLPDAPNGEVIPFILKHEIPSVVMTGRMDDVTRKKILNLPVIDYITKENTQAYHYLLRVLHSQFTNKDISVLVVDDSLTSRNQTAQLLKRRNFNVHVASDGTKALKVLAENPDIKIVVTDHEMPGMSGIELLQTIRKKHAHNELIVIGISGTKQDANSARFIKNGADDFLKKPLCPEEFYSRIMQHIEKLQYIDKIKLADNQDYLTGLLNYRYFTEKVTETVEFALDDSTSDILAVINIDNFTHLNVKHSSATGNTVLVALAKALKQQFPDQLLARLGGGEFAVFITADNTDTGIAQLKSLQQMASKVTVQENDIHFTMSIGATVLNTNNAIELNLKVASNALIKAKNQGEGQLILAP